MEYKVKLTKTKLTAIVVDITITMFILVLSTIKRNTNGLINTDNYNVINMVCGGIIKIITLSMLIWALKLIHNQTALNRQERQISEEEKKKVTIQKTAIIISTVITACIVLNRLILTIGTMVGANSVWYIEPRRALGGLSIYALCEISLTAIKIISDLTVFITLARRNNAEKNKVPIQKTTLAILICGICLGITSIINELEKLQIISISKNVSVMKAIRIVLSVCLVILLLITIKNYNKTNPRARIDVIEERMETLSNEISNINERTIMIHSDIETLKRECLSKDEFFKEEILRLYRLIKYVEETNGDITTDLKKVKEVTINNDNIQAKEIMSLKKEAKLTAKFIEKTRVMMDNIQSAMIETKNDLHKVECKYIEEQQQQDTTAETSYRELASLIKKQDINFKDINDKFRAFEKTHSEFNGSCEARIKKITSNHDKFVAYYNLHMAETVNSHNRLATCHLHLGNLYNKLREYCIKNNEKASSCVESDLPAVVFTENLTINQITQVNNEQGTSRELTV